MTHLTMDQLLALREPNTDPGMHGAQEHLAACLQCQEERRRLEQRVARLRALPTLRPARSGFAAVQSRLASDRRARAIRGVAWGSLALAASVLFAVVVVPAFRSAPAPRVATVSEAELNAAIRRSQQLEAMLQSIAPESRALDGRTAILAARLEDQLMLLDRQLQMANRLSPDGRTREQLRLWRERAGLLDALMDVHLTQARFAGL